MTGAPITAGGGIFSLRHRVEIDSGAHPALYRMSTKGSSTRAKRQESEADHFSRSSAKVNNAWSYTYSPNTSSWRGT